MHNILIFNHINYGSILMGLYGRKKQMSRDMRFQTMWYVRPAKAQTSLRIFTVWSDPLHVA